MKAQEKHPMISIIALNYNQLQVTSEFLESAKGLTYPNYEIIIVDNASSEDPTDALQRIDPNVTVIRNGENMGFSGGNNVGIRAAKGEFFFIVNNDTEVTPHLLERLIEPFQFDPDIGMVSPKIRFFSEPNIIQYAGYSAINPYTGRNKAIGSKQPDVGQFDTSGYTSYGHGAAMLVKRDVVEMAGGLPEVFFIYYEELDWSTRIREAGYKIYYEASALIYHKESVTMGKESLLKTYYHNRNRVLFMRRNSTTFQFSVFVILLILIIAPSKTFRYLIHLQFRHALFFLKALAWHFRTFEDYKYYSQASLTPIQN